MQQSSEISKYTTGYITPPRHRINTLGNSAFWNSATTSPYLVYDPVRPRAPTLLSAGGPVSSAQSEARPPGYQTVDATPAQRLPPPYQPLGRGPSCHPLRPHLDIPPVVRYTGPTLSSPSNGQTYLFGTFGTSDPPEHPNASFQQPQSTNALDLNLRPTTPNSSLPQPDPVQDVDLTRPATESGVLWPEQPEREVIVLPLFPLPYEEAEGRCKMIFGSQRDEHNIWRSPDLDSNLSLFSIPARQRKDDFSVWMKKEPSEVTLPAKSVVSFESIKLENEHASCRSSDTPDFKNIRLNPSIHHESFGTFGFSWDIRQPVSDLIPKPDILRQIAILPHLPKLTIVIKDICEYSFSIAASSRDLPSVDSHHFALTVNVVLEGIHKHLMSPISEEHWLTRKDEEKRFLIGRMAARINSFVYLLPDEDRSRIFSDIARTRVSMTEAVRKVLSRHVGQSRNEKDLKILAIDYLGTKTVFGGLSVDSTPNTLILHTK